MADLTDIVAGLFDDAKASGLFTESFLGEPKSAPGNDGLFLCLVNARITPVQSSGLVSISARAEFTFRIMKNMFSDPVEYIELDMLRATQWLMRALVGGFTLAGQARAVDILGMDGEQMRAEAGYISIGGNAQSGGSVMYRIMDVFCPVIVNDMWILAE